jgi:2-polyprenyl-3-methyl-5-hydroxy-6-metoxy-1,4-benzoquinol methylase
MHQVPPSELFHREHLDRNPERIIPGDVPPIAEAEHLSRYFFASKHVAGKRVLDAGCGVGYGAAVLANAGAAQVLAIDRSDEALAWARTHYGAPGLEFRQASFPPLPLRDFAVDVVCALEIIEHLEEDAAFVTECARVLVPGGVVIISTPNKAFTSPGWVTAKNRHHVREYYEREFRALVAPHFGSVALYGQRRGVRLGRFYKADALFRSLVDGPLGIIKALIPKRLRKAARSRITSAAAGGVDHNVTPADFVIEEGRTNEALAFLAVCRK